MQNNNDGVSSPQFGRRYPRESYTDEEIRTLLHNIPIGPIGYRNRTLILVMREAGLRLNEALKLQPSDIDLEIGELHVRYGKGSKGRGPKERRVTCGPSALAAIVDWLEVRRRWSPPPGAPLFCTRKGGELHQSYVRTTLHRLALRAGWVKRAHPHGLRHSYAVGLARAGVPVAIIQRQLGHTSLGTTTVYLSSLTTDDIREAMGRVQWPDYSASG